MTVRTRFAPSPTGFLHVGGIRTALFAWLLARSHGGQFILRLEDTDKAREVAGADQHIMDSLQALGLDWDEGPDKGGAYGPYRQSERLESYKQWGQKLIEQGRAYADPYTKEQLDEFRRTAQQQKKPFLFREHRPSAGQRTPAWDGSQPLRFCSEPKTYSWHDEVMGDISTGPEVIDDFILMKSDGYPTYNFAHIIDDHEMQISHVIRGQEFLASVPNYLNLYEALGFTRPALATMPHILGPDGNKKLSKRDGAKDVLDYIRQGFLPDALVNFIASLGWNDGTEQEIFSREELIAKFSLDHVQRSSARFDERRLMWMDGYYIRQLPIAKLYQLASDFWPETAKSVDEDYKRQVLGLVQERLKFLAEIPALSSFFFEEPAGEQLRQLLNDPPDKQLKKIEPPRRRELLQSALDNLRQSDFTAEDIRSRLNDLLVKLETKPGVLFALIRCAATGSAVSPELFGTLAVLGKDRSLARLGQAVEVLTD